MLHHFNRAANALISPSFRSQATTTFTTVSTVSPSAPLGLFENDLMFATLSTSAATVTITEPSGWTLLYESPTQTYGIWYKFATATDVSSFSYTWTLSATATGRIVISAWANTSGIECASIATARARNLTLSRCMAVGRIGRNRNVARFNIGPSGTITYPTSTEVYDTGTNVNAAAQLTTVAQGLSALEAGTTSLANASFLTASVALKPKLAIVDGNTNPYLVATSMLSNDSAYSSLVVPMPIGVQNGDFLVMVVASFNSLTGGATCTGWTQEDVFNASTRVTTVLRRTASSEPSTYTVTTNGRTTIHILAFRGATTSFAQKSNATPASGTTSWTATGVTTTANNALILDINVSINNSATTFTTPTGYDPITYGEADQSSTAIFMKQQAVAGATGNVTSTSSQASAGAPSLALLYTINPA